MWRQAQSVLLKCSGLLLFLPPPRSPLTPRAQAPGCPLLGSGGWGTLRRRLAGAGAPGPAVISVYSLKAVGVARKPLL